MFSFCDNWRRSRTKSWAPALHYWPCLKALKNIFNYMLEFSSIKDLIVFCQINSYTREKVLENDQIRKCFLVNLNKIVFRES